MFFSPVITYAQVPYQSDSDGVDVNAAVPEDTNSTLGVVPANVEIKERGLVTITIKDSNQDPVPNHYIELEASGLIFNQPTTPSNSQGKITVQVYANTPGTYNICAKDITYDDITIDILDCDILYVSPLPTINLLEEPEYTKGSTNTLFWNSIGSGYRYYVEVSKDSNFNHIDANSGWITGTMFEFTNLENEQMYFYRVKARNSYGGQSSWSNTQYSVQDSEDPTITPISIGDVGKNNNVEWDGNHTIDIVYKVEDNLSLKETNFYCVNQYGDKYNCGNVSNTGIFYTATITLNDLEREGVNDLFLTYAFCVDAKDSAGNASENCNFQLNIPKWEGDEEEPEPPQKVPTSIGRIVKDFIDNTQIVMDDMFGQLDNYSLQDISTTTTIATITIGIGSLLGGLIYIPIYLFQLLLGLLSWLGLRKKGKLSGYVYDSSTKEPVTQAVVRVYNTDDKLIWTDVTDGRGLFELALDDGRYNIKVAARGYRYPSKVIFGKKDYPLENVYHGSIFDVKNGNIPEFSIPIDSVEMNWFEGVLTTIGNRLRVFYKVLSLLFFIFGLFFSLYTYNLNPNWFNFIIVILYIPSFVLIVRSLFKKRLEYGVVRDENGNPVKGVTVGLKDIEYDRLVDKRQTDGNGKYRFVLDPGNYKIEILDPGYEVIEIEDKRIKNLSDGSVLVALDTVVKGIEVEN
jgi:hypothetical protein